MIKPSLPQDRAALIDKDFRVTLPYRRWMNDVTRRLAELDTSGPTIPSDPLAFTITGTGWITVTGSLESGNFNVTQRVGLTTDDLAEGSTNLYFPEAPEDGTAYGRKDAAWVAVASGGTGDVVGPASSVDSHVALFDGITGKLLKDGGAFTAAGIGADPAGSASAAQAAAIAASQPLDGDLTAIAGLSGVNGDIIYRSGGAWSRLGVGSTGNVLTVAAGAPAWATPVGLTNFTEGLNTSSPNATAPYVSFVPNNGATRVDVAIVPKSANGAFSLAVADGTATGGNKRGTAAVDLQLVRANATYVASGASSALIGGQDNVTGGASAVNAGGNTNSVSASRAFNGGGQSNIVSGVAAANIGGSSNAPSANGAVTLGGSGNAASGIFSVAHGFAADTRSIENSIAHGVAVNKQAMGVPLYIQTTSATPAVLASNSSAAAATNQYALPSNRAARVRVIVIARQSAGTGTGDVASWDFGVTLKNIAGTTSIVGTPSTAQSDSDAGAAAWAVAVAANNTLDTLEITVTGEASKTIQWTAYVVGPES